MFQTLKFISIKRILEKDNSNVTSAALKVTAFVLEALLFKVKRFWYLVRLGILEDNNVSVSNSLVIPFKWESEKIKTHGSRNIFHTIKRIEKRNERYFKF